MRGKNQLRTVRFTGEEATIVDQYLQQNPIFESFSALARVATLALIQHEGAVQLHPIPAHTTQQPSFLWDYDLTDIQVREILRSRTDTPKKEWLVARILREGRLTEVMQYLSPKTIAHFLPKIRLPERLQSHWKYTLQRWGYDRE